MKKTLIAFAFISQFVWAQKIEYASDSSVLQKLYTEVLERGKAYDDLYDLCKNIGPRLSGSLGAEMAVKWGFDKLKSYNFDTVYLQEVYVPNWKRGTRETAYITDNEQLIRPLNILALGGSVGTDGILSGELVLFHSLQALKNAPKQDVEGKIVFVAEHMKQAHVFPFKAYSEGGSIRWESPIIASEKGAKAVIVRSLSLSDNNYPNTGSMGYKEGVTRIPAAAISTNDANYLEKLVATNKSLTVHLEMDCRFLEDALSHNVIAEIKGSKFPNSIITIGGHLDSWDVSEGAHDDGAGIVHSMEAVRLLKAINYQPLHTIRVVFFMNEENGNKGANQYAKITHERNEKHLFALESDAGGFTPRGFSIDANDSKFKLIQKFIPLFQPYFIHLFEKGYAGVDITPLKSKHETIGLLGLTPDVQRYFDIHHNANDNFENVNKRELHLGAATMASMLYLLDKYGEK